MSHSGPAAHEETVERLVELAVVAVNRGTRGALAIEDLVDAADGNPALLRRALDKADQRGRGELQHRIAAANLRAAAVLATRGREPE